MSQRAIKKPSPPKKNVGRVIAGQVMEIVQSLTQKERGSCSAAKLSSSTVCPYTRKVGKMSLGGSEVNCIYRLHLFLADRKGMHQQALCFYRQEVIQNRIKRASEK